MEDKKSAGSSTGGGLVAVFIEPEDENKSDGLIGPVQWRTKRASDYLRVGAGDWLQFFFESEDENKSGRLIGLVQWRTKRAPDNLRSGGSVSCIFI